MYIKNGVEFNQNSKSELIKLWPRVGCNLEAEITYDTLVAHSALG